VGILCGSLLEMYVCLFRNVFRALLALMQGLGLVTSTIIYMQGFLENVCRSLLAYIHGFCGTCVWAHGS